MDDPYSVPDIVSAIQGRLYPTVTLWNRLEGRPRTSDFSRALKAEVRDALWMLTKQWQMGEFRGEDAGSPILVKLRTDLTRLSKYRPRDGAVEAFDDGLPLEARVERRPIRFVLGGKNVALDVRLVMGRQWSRMLKQNGLGVYEPRFLARYPIALPDPGDSRSAYVCAHPEAWQTVAAVAGRRMDCYALYAHLRADPGHHAYNGFDVGADGARIDGIANAFLAWFEQLFCQPPASAKDAWTPDRLEYQFSSVVDAISFVKSRT